MNCSENNIDNITMRQRIVNRHKSILRFSGVCSLIVSCFFVFKLLIDLFFVEGPLDYIRVSRLFRDFLLYLIQGVTFVFIINWSHLEKQKLTVRNHTDLVVLAYLKRNRFIRIGVMLFDFVRNIISHIIVLSNILPNNVPFMESSIQDVIKIVEKLSVFVLSNITYVAHIYMFNLLFEGITLLTADFIHFNEQLKSAKCKNDTSIPELLSLRQFHSQTIRSTNNFERFARCEIGRLYLSFLILYLSIIYNKIVYRLESEDKFMIIAIVNSLTVIILTIKAIDLHNKCFKPSETLYELSLPVRSDKYRDEVSSQVNLIDLRN